jgi:prepilin-type N-terminal cleavage/methylation domain-containing protein
MTTPSRSQRGLTLVEVTVAMVMASLVMVGLVGFYISSQMTWLAASSQAVSQREGTLAIEVITDHIRGAQTATIANSPDAQHQQLTLTFVTGGPVEFHWDATDSLIHWSDPANRGALIETRVTRFQMTENDTLVNIVGLDLLDPNGRTISFAGGAALYNRP